MDNTIHVNSTSRLLQAITRSLPAAQPGAFRDALAGAAAEQSGYKASVSRQIAAMPVHETRTNDNFRISITDAGYERMQADPDYESFVLETIRSELAAPNPAAAVAGSATIFLRFDQDPRQFQRNSFGNGDSALEQMDKSNKKTFWELRAERREKQEEINEKIADIRAQAKHVFSAKLQRGEAVSAADLSAASEIMSVLLTDILAGM